MARKSKRRELKRGERVVVVGIRGKPVKRIVKGRKYVVQIKRGNAVVATLNAKHSRGRHRGRPIPREVSKSAVDRLRFVRSVNSFRRPTSGERFKITNKKSIKEQITKEMLKEIRKNKGKAFSIQIEINGSIFNTIPRYMSGDMSNKSLENIITSDLIYQINRENFRISPKPEDITDKSKITRINQAQLEFQFHNVRKSLVKKKKSTKKKGKRKK